MAGSKGGGGGKGGGSSKDSGNKASKDNSDRNAADLIKGASKEIKDAGGTVHK